MDKGGGLSIDSDSIGFFLTKPTAFLASSGIHTKRKRDPMDSNHRFYLNCRDNDSGAASVDEEPNEKRVDEMDFFSDKTTRFQESDGKSSSLNNIIKKEELNETATRLNFDVNVSHSYWVYLLFLLHHQHHHPFFFPSKLYSSFVNC